MQPGAPCLTDPMVSQRQGSRARSPEQAARCVRNDLRVITVISVLAANPACDCAHLGCSISSNSCHSTCCAVSLRCKTWMQCPPCALRRTGTLHLHICFQSVSYGRLKQARAVRLLSGVLRRVAWPLTALTFPLWAITKQDRPALPSDDVAARGPAPPAASAKHSTISVSDSTHGTGLLP